MMTPCRLSPQHAIGTRACCRPPFSGWFAARGWRPRDHQLGVLEAVARDRSCLVIAPTGGGKTLAGFLPSLVHLARHGGGRGLHTLYVSPLKALTVDIKRNLERPVAEMALDVRLETRTGDTSAHRRRRQRREPPDILLTTPESLTLLLSGEAAADAFAGLRFVVVDELHAWPAPSAATSSRWVSRGWPRWPRAIAGSGSPPPWPSPPCSRVTSVRRGGSRASSAGAAPGPVPAS